MKKVSDNPYLKFQKYLLSGRIRKDLTSKSKYEPQDTLHLSKYAHVLQIKQAETLLSLKNRCTFLACLYIIFTTKILRIPHRFLIT